MNANANQSAERQHLSGGQRPEQVKDALIRARKSLENPNRWCGGVGPSSYDFSKLCAGIAIDAAAQDQFSRHAACELFRDVIGDRCIINWNDTPGRTHAEVMKAFDDAIAMVDHQSDGEASAAVSEADGPQ